MNAPFQWVNFWDSYDECSISVGDLGLSGSIIRKSRFIFTKAANHKAKERMFKSFKRANFPGIPSDAGAD